MPAQVLMIQGTASSVGKSLLVAALCRIFALDGFRVAPFKAQNMALNSFVTRDGREMGRSQVVQAQAAGTEPTIEMNPILLKPEADGRSQVVVLGRPWLSLPAGDYYTRQKQLWQVVVESLAKLRQEHELVIIEGAGSPAEINLRQGDIVNMRVAQHASAPVLLVGDIDRGGVFASLVGTMVLLNDEERRQIRGFIINKFRGDVGLLRPGLTMLEERTGVPVLGVVPYLPGLRIAQEDSVFLEEERNREQGQIGIVIAVIRLPHISNFDDFDPLAMETGVTVRYVQEPSQLGRPAAIIIPGTKSTVADLCLLRKVGLDQAIVRLARQGIPLVGICGGFQMLGRTITDPLHIESQEDMVEGLGLLDIDTIFLGEKTTYQVKAQVVSDRGFLDRLRGQEISGYEIHMGQTQGAAPIFRIVERGGRPVIVSDGAASPDGRVFGTYIHGLFDNPNLRRAWLGSLGLHRFADWDALSPVREAEYDRLANHVRASLDMAAIYQLAGLSPK